jgi:prephenate dehydrogenase
MDFKQVAIIGTDCISVSIALGLKTQSQPPKIVAYDVDPRARNQARGMRAVDRVERQPGLACRNADLVIVAVPLPAMRETFAAIAPHLQPGCLVTDTAFLKAPVMRWAKELLPENVFFVGGHPILNPAIVGSAYPEDVEEASADLLKEALYCLTPPTGSVAAADAFVGLITALEAHPYFIDVTEHDGLEAGVEGLPDLLAVALVHATVDTPGWQEMRKFADYRFAAATASAAGSVERPAALSLNREHILRRLNVLLSELVRLRDLLNSEDVEALEETFATAAEGRAYWLEEREQGMWTKERRVRMDQVPTTGEHFQHMLFGDMSGRLRKKADQS